MIRKISIKIWIFWFFVETDVRFFSVFSAFWKINCNQLRLMMFSSIENFSITNSNAFFWNFVINQSFFDKRKTIIKKINFIKQSRKRHINIVRSKNSIHIVIIKKKSRKKQYRWWICRVDHTNFFFVLYNQ